MTIVRVRVVVHFFLRKIASGKVPERHTKSIIAQKNDVVNTYFESLATLGEQKRSAPPRIYYIQVYSYLCIKMAYGFNLNILFGVYF